MTLVVLSYDRDSTLELESVALDGVPRKSGQQQRGYKCRGNQRLQHELVSEDSVAEQRYSLLNLGSVPTPFS